MKIPCLSTPYPLRSNLEAHPGRCSVNRAQRKPQWPQLAPSHDLGGGLRPAVLGFRLAGGHVWAGPGFTHHQGHRERCSVTFVKISGLSLPVWRTGSRADVLGESQNISASPTPFHVRYVAFVARVRNYACVHIIIWLPSASSTKNGNSFSRNLVGLLRYHLQCLDEYMARGKCSIIIHRMNEGSPALSRSVLSSGITDGKGSFLAPSQGTPRAACCPWEDTSCLWMLVCCHFPVSKLLGRATLVWIQCPESRGVQLTQTCLPLSVTSAQSNLPS